VNYDELMMLCVGGRCQVQTEAHQDDERR